MPRIAWDKRRSRRRHKQYTQYVGPAQPYMGLGEFHETVINNPYIPLEPHPRQAKFLACNHQEAFYGGAAGGGKSQALLMAALQYVHVPGYAAIIFRATYKRLSLPNSIMDRAKQWIARHPDVHWNESEHRATFPSGATLTFGHLQHENDKYNYLGPEFQFIGFDEATEFSYSQYKFLFIRLRRIVGMDVPLRVRSASNPGGKGHEWVKRRFVEPEGYYPDRVFIRATIADNPSLNREEYEATLSELDPVTKAQYLRGDWTAREQGGKFHREWVDYIYDDEIPQDTYFVRYWDIAATEPKPGEDPDYTAGVLMGELDGRFYVADVRRFRGSPKATEDFVKETAKRDGPNIPIYMEEEPGASGKITISHFGRHALRGYAFYGNPTRNKGKEVRFNPFSAAAQRGDVDIVRGAFNDYYVDEMELFPYGEHDDMVDATSGAYEVLARTPSGEIDETISEVEEEIHDNDLFY